MTLPDQPSLPTESGSRARRRRDRRLIIPQDAKGQSALLGNLARRAYPTYELFIFAVLSGAVLGLGYLLDSQAILLLGILLAPLMTPWVAMLLALLLGSPRFFFETFMALLISAALVFLCGLMTGFAARLFMPRTFNDVYFHSRLWIPELIALCLGAILLIVSFVRSETKPYLPSVVIAYAFLLPVSASGFGLGSGLEGVALQGTLVFCVHFALASLIGLVTLFALKFRPSPAGILLSGAALIGSLAILIYLMGSSPQPALSQSAEVSEVATEGATLSTSTAELNAIPPIDSLPQASLTPRPATATPFEVTQSTPVPLTLEVTLPPTETPTVTLTIEPTPVLARIMAREGGGAVMRENPAGSGITVLENYTVVELLPETQDVSGWTWSHIIANQNSVRREGWVLQIVLEMATPVPNWLPSSTPTVTPAEESTAIP
jgi:hypothetical protein